MIMDFKLSLFLRQDIMKSISHQKSVQEHGLKRLYQNLTL